MRNRTKCLTIAGVCLVAVAVAVAGTGTWAVLDSGRGTSAVAAGASSERPTTTGSAEVTKGDLTDSRVFAGTLGYGATTAVPGAAAGTLTWLPKPGDVIERDQPLYAVDERPVRALYGSTPLWRDLRSGVRGADVRQLNENLAALGYDVSVDDSFGPRTRAAVRQWQRDRGLEVTGVLSADDVAFVDGAVRVAAVPSVLGRPAGGDVLSVTSTRRVVTASVSQRDADRLAVGTGVEVRVNGSGEPMRGKVVDAAPGEGKDGSATVDVTVDFDPGDRKLPAAASAQIEAAGTTERDVLSVPVAALVARGASGGYAVDVVRGGGTTKRVPVRAGFVADGRVVISGDVHAGDRVVVPS
jgi:peptidoglycan hydrolase-like protein with peptidoglycan-binding domain